MKEVRESVSARFTSRPVAFHSARVRQGISSRPAIYARLTASAATQSRRGTRNLITPIGEEHPRSESVTRYAPKGMRGTRALVQLERSRRVPEGESNPMARAGPLFSVR